MYLQDFLTEDITDEGDTEYVLPHKLKKENNSSKRKGQGKEKGKENTKKIVRKNVDGMYVCRLQSVWQKISNEKRIQKTR